MNKRFIYFIFQLLIFSVVSLKIHAQPMCNRVATPSNQKIEEISKINQSLMLQNVWPCFEGVLQGAWEASGGLVVNALECVGSPIKCARAAKKGIQNSINFVKDLNNNIEQISASLAMLPPEAASQIVCGVMGGLATDVIIAIFTMGAGAAKISLTLTKLTNKLQRLSKLNLAFNNFPIHKIAHLSELSLFRVKTLLRSGHKDEVMKLIEGGACSL